MKPRIGAIGSFDGVHRGHLAVISKLRQLVVEEGYEPVVVTFSNHPLSIVDPSRVPDELTPLEKKKKLLKEAGVTPLVFDFNESLRAMTAEEWLRELHDKHEVEALVIGYDNTFGSDGLNLSIEDYKKIGEKSGIKVYTAEEVAGVSSSAIRKAVRNGEMEKAAALLGRPYSITSKVVRGNKLGSDLGFPTANVLPPMGVALPSKGAYAAIVKIPESGEKVPAMVNIGTRPTVMRGDDMVMEAHLIDWKGDLYDKEITVRFLKKLRDERKFESIEALRKQLAEDQERVKELMD